MRFAPSPAGRRVVVEIDLRQEPRAAVAELAHQLYHALEIARDSDVVDEATLDEHDARTRDWFCRTSHDGYWDTRAALAFEALVTRQLTAAPLPSSLMTHR